MRPRVFPAEDLAFNEGRCVIGTASMRPRVFPAEDVRVLCGAVLMEHKLQ